MYPLQHGFCCSYYLPSLQETLIEGILEKDFEGSDVDAVLSVLKEFRFSGSAPHHVRDLLGILDGFYEIIDHKKNTVIDHLNSTNSMVCC